MLLLEMQFVISVSTQLHMLPLHKQHTRMRGNINEPGCTGLYAVYISSFIIKGMISHSHFSQDA